MEQRIEDLEVRFAFLEENLRQLDEVVRAQAERIEALQRELAEVREQVAQGPGEDAPPDEQVPPHWGTVG